MSIAEIYSTLEYGPAPEAAEPAMRWIAEHEGRFGLFIDGEWHSPVTGEYFDTVNPATGKPLASVAQAGIDDVNHAVIAARRAFETWSKTPGHVRARYLYALARQIQRHSRLFSVLESLDNGKPIRESRDIDIPLVARHFYYHAGWAQLMEDELAGYESLGVVGQIIPWNFPLLMLAWKVAPALAMGNTVILKPAEFTPLTALAFVELVERAGLPPGVVNVVTGDGRTGECIVQHPDIDKIAFTGSTEVGRHIRQQTAGSGKRLSLELGGKSPFLVFEDADLDSVVEGVVDAIWFNQGQVCCAGSRLLVEESIEQRLIDKLRERMERLRIGDPLDKAIDIGAVIAPVQLQKIKNLVDTGESEGATKWQPSWACPTDGYFYPPTLFTDVSPASTIAQVEIFGPVLVEMSFRSPAEAVALANNTPYGLAASVWTEDINLAFDIARQLKAGTVWINSTNLFDAASGFGGYRESGFGREGGKEGLWEYVRRIAHAPVDVPPPSPDLPQKHLDAPLSRDALPPIDRTPKMFIGGKQVRSDSGYSRLVRNAAGIVVGEVGSGNRKDIRNAVEAAAASRWGEVTGHARAQILYFIAENLASRAAEFARRLVEMDAADQTMADNEVELAIQRTFSFAAWADKYDGDVHQPPLRGITIAMPEPIGVMGVVCPSERPLLGFVTCALAPVAMGNTVVVIPSEPHPLSATDMYQVLETSDVSAGVINIVTGERKLLTQVLAEHDAVDGLWYVGDQDGVHAVEYASAGNMKRTWCPSNALDVLSSPPGHMREILRECTQVKNIWSPYGI
ncbi:MAG TPA: aldehyde dehydrogenase family protein [Chloroflexota bacterium]